MQRIIIGVFLLAGSLPVFAQATGCGGRTLMNSIRAGNHVVSVGEHVSRVERKSPHLSNGGAYGWRLSGNRIAWAYHDGAHVIRVYMQCPDTGSRRR